MDQAETAWSIYKHTKKELEQYPAILNSRPRKLNINSTFCNANTSRTLRSVPSVSISKRFDYRYIHIETTALQACFPEYVIVAFCG